MGSSQSTLDRSEMTQANIEKFALRQHHQAASQPLSEDGAISLENVAEWEEDAIKDLKVQLARTILVDADFKTALTARDARIADSHVFNLELNFKTDPITNQKSSGRCWLFATTNVLRHAVMQKLGLKEFQLSQVSTPPAPQTDFSK